MDELGRGGFATVHRALSLRSTAIVALKLVWRRDVRITRVYS